MERFDPMAYFPARKVAVVAIDLGTACTGLSIMTRADPESVTATSPRAQPNQHKEPTVMVKTEDGSWLFGIEALEYFRQKMEEDNEEEDQSRRGLQVSRMRLFRTFKLNLLRAAEDDDYDEVVVPAKNTAAQSPLLEVYTQCLCKLRDFGLTRLARELGRAVSKEEVAWVLTVPAAMNDWAKGFMREAACRAELVHRDVMHLDSHLLIIPEPDAAAIALAHAHNQTIVGGVPSNVPRGGFFTVGRRFCVLDCGGGTVDLTSHEVVQTAPSLTLRPLALCTGGNYGSELVNGNFARFLEGLLQQLDEGFLTEVKQGKRAAAFQHVLQAFDDLKLSTKPVHAAEGDSAAAAAVADARISLRDVLDSSDLLTAMTDIVAMYNASSPTPITKYVARTGMMTLSHELMLSFFEPWLTEIVRCVRSLLTDALRQHAPVDVIAVVGGFAASEVLRDRLTTVFAEFQPPVTFIFPSMRLHPQAAVLYGAARAACRAQEAVATTAVTEGVARLPPTPAAAAQTRTRLPPTPPTPPQRVLGPTAAPTRQQRSARASFDHYRRLAEQGHARAQYILGNYYRKGTGGVVQVQPEEAVKWYRLAVAQHHSGAYCNLGYCYQKGIGVPKSHDEGMRLYREAATRGSVAAQANLAYCYWKGRGVPVDLAAAVEWYRSAATRGYAKAQTELGNFYLKCIGVPADPAEGVRWLRLAAEQDYPTALYKLGRCYELGNGVVKNLAEAVIWFRRGADKKSSQACYYLGRCYELGLGVVKNVAQAANWYQRAQAGGVEEANEALQRVRR